MLSWEFNLHSPTRDRLDFSSDSISSPPPIWILLGVLEYDAAARKFPRLRCKSAFPTAR